MHVIERLDVEHRLLLCQLDDVAEAVERDAPAESWHAVILTLAHVLEQHMGLEERLLFRAVAAARPECAPLMAELAREHRAIERLAREARADTRGSAALALVDALRRHVERETYELFPLADEGLPPARLRLPRLGLTALPAPRRRHPRGDWPERFLG